MKTCSIDDLEALRPEWETLWRSDARATPFQSPAWLVPWTRHLWGGGQLLILDHRQDGDLIGLLPLFRWGLGTTTVSLLGAGVSDYGDVLGSLPGIDLPYDSILEEIPSDSSLLNESASEPCSVCPVLNLNDYPACRNVKLAVDLRRARNKLSRVPHAFSRLTDPDVFFELHKKRWNLEPDPRIEAFQREVATEFARLDLLRLHLLTIEETPAASIFAIAAHGTLYCYLTAYDPAFTKLSPGALLLAHAIDEAKAEGLQAVDFLRGAEPYKYLWGAKDRVNYRVRPEMRTAEATEQSAS